MTTIICPQYNKEARSGKTYEANSTRTSFKDKRREGNNAEPCSAETTGQQAQQTGGYCGRSEVCRRCGYWTNTSASPNRNWNRKVTP